jgi:hypothetical protein
VVILQHKSFANQAVARRYVGMKNSWFLPLEFRIGIIQNYRKMRELGVNLGNLDFWGKNKGGSVDL